MNGNEYDRRSVTPSHAQQSNGSTAALISSNSLNGSNRKNVNQNGSQDFNGNGIDETGNEAAAAVKLNSTYENSASTVSNLSNVKPPKMPLAWNASITNWINQTTKGS